jgi:hypothetical protein
MTELVNEHVALTDYHFKAQARHFWDVLDTLQDIRQGARDRARN